MEKACVQCGGTGWAVTYWVDPKKTGDYRPVRETREVCPKCKGLQVTN